MFAAKLAGAGSREGIEDRVRRLARFYRTVGETEVTVSYEPALPRLWLDRGGVMVEPRRDDSPLVGRLPPAWP